MVDVAQKNTKHSFIVAITITCWRVWFGFRQCGGCAAFLDGGLDSGAGPPLFPLSIPLTCHHQQRLTRGPSRVRTLLWRNRNWRRKYSKGGERTQPNIEWKLFPWWCRSNAQWTWPPPQKHTWLFIREDSSVRFSPISLKIWDSASEIPVFLLSLIWAYFCIGISLNPGFLFLFVETVQG